MSLIDPELLSILACPACHAPVEERPDVSQLWCTDCGRRYPVTDGIPVMLVEEAEMPGGDEAG